MDTGLRQSSWPQGNGPGGQAGEKLCNSFFNGRFFFFVLMAGFVKKIGQVYALEIVVNIIIWIFSSDGYYPD
jgi:hypothetical protein